MADENEIIEEVDTGETEDLAQDYLDEDPSILTEEELNEIARNFGLTPEEMKALARNMSRTRRKFAEQENYTV